jgi:hypothetical protein
MATDRYLAAVLADAVQPFRYRAGTAALLGQPDSVGPELTPTPSPGRRFPYLMGGRHTTAGTASPYPVLDGEWPRANQLEATARRTPHPRSPAASLDDDQAVAVTTAPARPARRRDVPAPHSQPHSQPTPGPESRIDDPRPRLRAVERPPAHPRPAAAYPPTSVRQPPQTSAGAPASAIPAGAVPEPAAVAAPAPESLEPLVIPEAESDHRTAVRRPSSHRPMVWLPEPAVRHDDPPPPATAVAPPDARRADQPPGPRQPETSTGPAGPERLPNGRTTPRLPGSRLAPTSPPTSAPAPPAASAPTDLFEVNEYVPSWWPDNAAHIPAPGHPDTPILITPSRLDADGIAPAFWTRRRLRRWQIGLLR